MNELSETMPDPMKKNLSFLNPTDATLAQQSGMFKGAKTVNDVLTQLGIDPMGPPEQLLKFGQKQMENADPSMKMRNIAMDSGRMPGNEQAGPPPMEETGGLDKLLGGL